MTKKTKARASSDVGFIFTAYSLRRLINIIGISKLGAYLKEILSIFFTYILTLKPKISYSKLTYIFEILFPVLLIYRQKGLYLQKLDNLPNIN